MRLGEVRPAGDGVDVEFWVLDMSAEALARAVSPITAGERTDSVGTMWRANGMRVFKAPSGTVAQIGQRLPMQGQTRRDALPLLPRWSPVALGRTWSSGVDVWLDQQDWSGGGKDPGPAVSTGRLALGAGALRLLARTWPVAAPADVLGGGTLSADLPAALVVQLVPQHVESSRLSSDRIGEAPDPERTSPWRQGQVLERLVMELPCERGESIVIVPAHPREKWLVGEASAGSALPAEAGKNPPPRADPSPQGPLIEPRPARENPEEPPTDAPGHAPDGAFALGPGIPDLLSLGEAMLTDASVGNGAHRRVILVITPRVPAKFDPFASAMR